METISRLRDENDPLEVIGPVDIFNEGIDIPEITHVLFLRPTQLFTIFLQRLGRGLRRVPGKNSLVAIDFVGNFRRAHVAPLALAGFTSVEQYAEACRVNGRGEIGERIPAGCYVNAEFDAAGHQGRLFPETFEAPHGGPPDIRVFPDYGKIADWVAEKIRQLADEEGYSNVHFVCKN